MRTHLLVLNVIKKGHESQKWHAQVVNTPTISEEKCSASHSSVLCLVGLTTSQFSFLFSLSPWQVLKITKTYVSFITSAKLIVQEYTIRNDGNILSLVCLWNNGNFSLFSSSLVLCVTSDLIFLCSK